MSSGAAPFVAYFLIVLSFALPAIAQGIETSETAATARQQVPTDEKAAAEVAEFFAKNVPAAPLPAGSPQLDQLRQRAANLQKQHAQYHEDIASGKTIPFADLHETLPQRISDLKALTLSLDEISTETDPAKKQLLSKAFFAALQPLGGYLAIADPSKGYLNILSAEQQAEYTRLEQAWSSADNDYDTKAKSLHIVGPGQLYTITNLSVPIIVQAPPSSKVIFQTFGGGFFSNKLAFIEVEANEAGIAQAEWVTYGDSNGDTLIGVRSKAAPPAENITITTVQLKLSDLPELPQLPEKAPEIPSGKIPTEIPNR